MKHASITDAKNSFSRLVDAVREGSTIWITDHNVPVARLVPVGDGGSPPAGRLIELVRAGLARPPLERLNREHLAALRRPVLSAGESAVRALCDERGGKP